MGRNFLQLKGFLEDRYPQLEGNVTGSHHEPPMIGTVLSYLVGVIQVVGLVSVFMGDSVFQFIPFMNGVPDWYHSLRENPMGAIILVFFVLPSISQSFSASGAFEVMFDDVVIFSKLETGRMPSAGDIIMGLSKYGLVQATTQ